MLLFSILDDIVFTDVTTQALFLLNLILQKINKNPHIDNLLIGGKEEKEGIT